MAERRFWIGVAAKDHVDRGVREGFCMFEHGKHAAVLRLSPGDRFAYYAPMTGIGAGEVVRAFTALGEIAPGDPYVAEMGAGTGWRREARYFPAQAADIYPLLEHFSFIRNRSHWGMAFRRSLFEITPHDFTVIAEAMHVTLPTD